MKPTSNALILYEDTNIIICHKPAGIAVQTSRIGSQDMVSLLKNHLSETRAQGHQKDQKTGRQNREPYLAVIHRLDQPVEGLLVFATTPKAAKELNRQLTSSGFGKYYRALVLGIPEPPNGTLEDYLVKDARTNTSRVCTKDTPGAKLARLHYHVKEICTGLHSVTSLVEIQLDTGRHHQIRVQMAHLGCPLVGDRKYGAADIPSVQTGTANITSITHKKNAESLKLCAYRLEFRHPESGEKMTFSLD